jgi:hypothetical protein
MQSFGCLRFYFEFDPIEYQFVAPAEPCRDIAIGTTLDLAVANRAAAKRARPDRFDPFDRECRFGA